MKMRVADSLPSFEIEKSFLNQKFLSFHKTNLLFEGSISQWFPMCQFGFENYDTQFPENEILNSHVPKISERGSKGGRWFLRFLEY